MNKYLILITVYLMITMSAAPDLNLPGILLVVAILSAPAALVVHATKRGWAK